MKYQAKVEVRVYVPAQTVEVEANSVEEAEDKIIEMWEKGELEWLMDAAELDDFTHLEILEETPTE